MAEQKAGRKEGHLGRALASIDAQAPSLKYLGLSFWIAWNTIAFSGSFWLRDTENSLRSENLIFVHLVACVITLALFAVTSNRSARLVANGRFVLAGGLIAAVGTVFIVVAREDLLRSMALFNLGSVLSGTGTTVLFLRAAPMFGALPPRRALSMLACCMLLSIAVYFALNCCAADVACAGFAALPLLSVLFYALHRKETRLEQTVARTGTRFSRKLAVFFGSIGLCSFAFELAKAFILAALPPAYSSASMLIAQFVVGSVMLAIIVATLLMQDRYNYGKYYSTAVFALAVLLIAIAALALRTTTTAALASAVCNCFNLVVWSMFAYLAFQAEAGALQVFGFGNAALSAGTALASLAVGIVRAEQGLYDDAMRAALVVLGVVVLVDLVFVFSERQISELLVPLDQQRRSQDTLGAPARQPKQWVLTCEAIAEAQGLSEREREVFVALARGKTAQEIAERDVLSVYTVRAHIRSIYAKLDVHSKKELVRFIEDRLGE